MKKVLIACSMIAATTFAHAQSATWDENTGRSVNNGASRGNTFSDIELEVNGKIVSFTHVPELSQEIRVLITNTSGEQVAQKLITPMNSALNVHELHKGKMYFVSLQCNGKTQKAFTLHL